jgi:transcriptional regulator with XRE-family HTH domain
LLHGEAGHTDSAGQRGATACLFDGGEQPRMTGGQTLGVEGRGVTHTPQCREFLNPLQAREYRTSQRPSAEKSGIVAAMDDARHKQQVGDRLRVAREALGLEQREMARLYGIDHTKLSHWERGKHYPAPTFIARLWERHRIPADWIYLGEVSGVPHRLADSLLAGAKASAADHQEATGRADESGADRSSNAPVNRNMTGTP